ncbi:hypothetical protein EG68_00581 [Paragonimus skrjabini miyazakii]|uniref:Uncharacterized protein n=1 Tax=Paragonimus skrjabini miyazakii TaxID=59628 RepID=A0A8S9Z998_9TREM|nr:hypothetical protein EG68_00581 [Paragonimus skrjabini miyazakii]
MFIFSFCKRSINNGSKMNSEKYFHDEFKTDNCHNSAIPIGISTAYCPTISSCQLVQPLCNGAGYISAIDPRLLNSTQPATYLTGCPTILSGADIMRGPHSSTPDFIPTVSLQTCGNFDVINGQCVFTAENGQMVHNNVPQITTLDLTSGIPQQMHTHSVYSGDAASGRSSLEQTHAYSPHSKNEATEAPLSPTHSGSGSLQLRQPSIVPIESATMGIQTGIHGITYVINDHATNV